MFRFTIRELALVTVIVAVVVGWWIDHSRTKSENRELKMKYDDLVSFVGDKYEYISRDAQGRWHSVMTPKTEPPHSVAK